MHHQFSCVQNVSKSLSPGTHEIKILLIRTSSIKSRPCKTRLKCDLASNYSLSACIFLLPRTLGRFHEILNVKNGAWCLECTTYTWYNFLFFLLVLQGHWVIVSLIKVLLLKFKLSDPLSLLTCLPECRV